MDKWTLDGARVPTPSPGLQIPTEENQNKRLTDGCSVNYSAGCRARACRPGPADVELVPVGLQVRGPANRSRPRQPVVGSVGRLLFALQPRALAVVADLNPLLARLVPDLVEPGFEA